MKESCSCKTCQGACTHKPGWFKPEQIEPVASSFGMSTKDFFKKRLAVDWHEDYGDDNETIFVIAPVLKREEAGTEYPGDPRGECIFFKDGKCEIHDFKPFECAKYFHNEKFSDNEKRHVEVAASWKDHQEMIKELLGREPIEKEFHGANAGILGGFF